jgi:regulator of ribonuclease activity A
MSISTPDLCDAYPDLIRVVAPLFTTYGGKASFGGAIVTVKCFEDNSLVREQVRLPGTGKVLVVDGGGSLRRALLGDRVAAAAADNGWEGLIIFGGIRDVDAVGRIALGVKALGAIPVKTEKRGLGDLNIAVTFGGVTFHPGEYVYADNNGIIVSAEPLLPSG